MGKGSNRRREDIAKIWNNWDAIFKKDKPAEEPKETKQEPDTEQDALKDNAK